MRNFFRNIYISNKYKSNSLYPGSQLFITFCMLWCPDRAISHFRCLKSRSSHRSFVVSQFRTFAVSQRPFVVSHHPFAVSLSRTSAHSFFRIALSQFRLDLSRVCMALLLFRILVVSQSRNFASPFSCFASPFRCFVVANFRPFTVSHRPFVVSQYRSFVASQFRTFVVLCGMVNATVCHAGIHCQAETMM